MKKLLLILGLALAALPLKAYDFSDTGEDGVTIYYTVVSYEDGTCEVSPGYSFYSDAVIRIPSIASYGYKVIGIGDDAFAGSTSVSGVYLPGCLEYIGERAFLGSGITSIAIPSPIKSIGKQAFGDCTELRHVVCDADVPADIRLGDNVFENVDFSKCSLVTPNMTNSLYNGADQWDQFYMCWETDYDFVEDCIPYRILERGKSDVEVRAAYAEYSGFYNSPDEEVCWAIIPGKAVHNGEEYTVVGIGDEAFRLSDLTMIDLPSTLKYIGTSAFFGCKLGDIHIPDSVEKIYDTAFSNCTDLAYVAIENPYPLEIEVAADAFDGVDMTACVLLVPKERTSSYKSMAVWGDFKNIGELPYHFTFDDIPYEIMADNNCAVTYKYGEHYYVETIEIPAEVEFDSNTHTVTGLREYAFASNLNTKKYILPPTIEFIEDLAFSCNNLESINLPASLKSLGSYVFDATSLLKSLICEVPDPADIALGTDVFVGIRFDECVLYVPKESIDLYRAADQWKDFLNIQDIESGIDDVAIDAPTDDTVSPAVYYNLNGAAVSAADLAPGLYIRRQGTTATKVIIR